MKTDQILNLDCRNEENKKIIQKVLRKIKPLSKYSDENEVPMQAIEKVIMIISNKYFLRIAQIYADTRANDEAIVWRAVIYKNEICIMQMIYGLSMYELLAKCAIYMYAESKKCKRK